MGEEEGGMQRSWDDPCLSRYLNSRGNPVSPILQIEK